MTGVWSAVRPRCHLGDHILKPCPQHLHRTGHGEYDPVHQHRIDALGGQHLGCQGRSWDTNYPGYIGDCECRNGRVSVSHLPLLSSKTRETTPARILNNPLPFSSHPLPFNCVITPRFPDAEAIVARTRELL